MKRRDHTPVAEPPELLADRALSGKLRHRRIGSESVGAKAIGALALGALAIGALAIGAVAIGKLAIGRTRIRRLEVDELVVRQVRITGPIEEPRGLDEGAHKLFPRRHR